MRRFSRPIRMAAAVLASALLAAPGHAAVVFGQDFTLNSVVDYGATWIQLTRSDETFDRGSAFATTPLALSAGQSFEAMFGFRILGGTDGADGLTLTFISSGPTHLGQAGGNLGFYGIRGGDGRPLPFGPAYAVAIDTYRNGDYGDLGSNNVSTFDSSSYQLRHTAASPYDLNDGGELFAWAVYDGEDLTMSVFVNDAPVKPALPVLWDPIDLSAWLGDRAWVGFTGATGGLTNEHRVTAFSLTVEPAQVPVPGTAVLAAVALLALGAVRRRRLRVGAA